MSEHKTTAVNGPISQTQRNMDAFCLNLIYASACHYTVQAYQSLQKAPETPQTNDDLKFYLETLFSRPFVKDV